MRTGTLRIGSIASLAFLLVAGCEGRVNDDENFFVLTFRASLNPGGTELTGPSERPQITPDGRFVVFQTRAADLVTGDENGKFDIYRKDLTSGQVIRVSIEGSVIGDTDVTLDPNENCINPSVTSDGRYVVFESTSPDIVQDAGGARSDIFLRDIQLGVTTWISKPVTDPTSNDNSHNPTISDDGRYVAFESFATNLVVGDGNGSRDVFVRDTLFGTTALISRDVNSVQGNGHSAN